MSLPHISSSVALPNSSALCSSNIQALYHVASSLYFPTPTQGNAIFSTRTPTPRQFTSFPTSAIHVSLLQLESTSSSPRTGAWASPHPMTLSITSHPTTIVSTQQNPHPFPWMRTCLPHHTHTSTGRSTLAFKAVILSSFAYLPTTLGALRSRDWVQSALVSQYQHRAGHWAPPCESARC